MIVTDYGALKEIRFTDLFDGRLAALGVREHVTDNTNAGRRCLTDGETFVWAYADGNGNLARLTQGSFAPLDVLHAIRNIFDTGIVSHHDPRYHGYDTQEEMDAADEEMAEKHKDEYYNDLIEYLKGDESRFERKYEGRRTIGVIQAEIALRVVAEDPELMLPSNKQRLLEAIDAVYERDHVV